MRFVILVVLLCGAVGVLDNAVAKHKDSGGVKMGSQKTGPQFSWRMARVRPDRLRIDYTVRNGGAGRLYVCDKLVVARPNGKYARTPAPIVMNADEAGLVRVILGSVSSNRPAAGLHPPTYRSVEAGASIDGSVEVPLPLAAWHPVGGADPIKAGAERISLEVQTLSGEPRWATLATDDPQPLRVPDGGPKIFLKAAPQPLPAT